MLWLLYFVNGLPNIQEEEGFIAYVKKTGESVMYWVLIMNLYDAMKFAMNTSANYTMTTYRHLRHKNNTLSPSHNSTNSLHSHNSTTHGTIKNKTAVKTNSTKQNNYSKSTNSNTKSAL